MALTKSTKLLRAKKLMDDLAKCGGSRKAVAKMRNTTPQNISRQLKKPYVEEYIEKSISRHLDEAGVTDQFISKKVKSLMGAKTVAGKDGDVVIPDNSVQLGATRLAFQVKGHLSSVENQTNIQVNIGLSESIKAGRERINGQSQNQNS